VARSGDVRASATRWLPFWARELNPRQTGADLLAGLVIAAVLVPQGMAYALLAGLPPQAG
jgi:sulfate permease, SulP family